MTTASRAAAVGITVSSARVQARITRGRQHFWSSKPANVGVIPWASAIPRFKRRCSDRDGNTRLKSKPGRSGKGSCTDCRTVLYASPNHKLENFDERFHGLLTVRGECSTAEWSTRLCTFPDDGFVRRNLFALPRRAPSGCRVCNGERRSDLLLVPGPVKG